jgi:uncharacterized repeat protein (TIGR03806 family)
MFFGVWALGLAGCGGATSTPEPQQPAATDSADTVTIDVNARRPAMLLSDYHLFSDLPNQVPSEGVVPYRLSTPQFLDYAQTRNYVYVPSGEQATYDDSRVFDFPVGTVFIQTLSFANDLNDPAAGEQTVETRLLIHQTKGWVAVPYIWNEEGTDADRAVVGGKTDVTWRHTDGNERQLQFATPDMNQCKRCHKNEEIVRPIGPKSRNLNLDIETESGRENQLVHWAGVGMLKGLPQDVSTVARAPNVYDSASGTVEERARTWLDVNCAHCHNPVGPAIVSGLDLSLEQTTPTRFGVYKPPIAAGLGSAGFRFGIEPGLPEKSFLLSRIRSTDPNVMMPTVGRTTVDEEGTALVEQWIAEMSVDSDLVERALNPVAAYQDALGGGDPARGREVFFNKIKCQTCHTADAPEGGEVGPSLADIGSREQADYILESIVAPSAKIVKKYETVTVLLDSGLTVSGTFSREDVYEVVLNQLDGKQVSVSKEEIEDRFVTEASIMPTVANLLSVEEVGDLVAFLMTLKQAPARE